MYKYKTTFIAAITFILMVFAFSLSAKTPKQQIIIQKTDGSIVVLKIEIADDNESRAQGLMNRESMPNNQGMLFLFEKEEVVEMWMKNTLIPLDMIFIGADGRIKNIVKNTTPHSLNTISSGVAVTAVLEINASMADKRGITEGDVVLEPKTKI